MSRQVLALLLVVSVALAAAGTTPDESANQPTPHLASNAQACPLTLAEENKATTAFEKMMPVLTHPRCFNCHGGVNERLPSDEGGHLGRAVPDDRDCKDCHSGARILNRPGRFGWSTPVSPFFFVNKSSRDLCNQFKELEPDPAKFIAHMVNDKGNTQFAEAAYRGERGLNAYGKAISKEETGRDMVPEPPPIPHARLVAYATEWANTVGAAGWKIPDCGCRLGGDAWEGTVSTSWTQREPGFGTLTETMKATARFEIDSSLMIPGDPGLTWKSTSGLIKWTVIATGGMCTTSASGTVPIGLGGDDNPMATIRMEPDSTRMGPDSTRAIRYSVNMGPWPDAYQPRFVYKCRAEPRIHSGIPYAIPGWWNQDLKGDTLSTDGKTMKGSLTAPLMFGTVRWIWDFKLIK